MRSPAERKQEWLDHSGLDHSADDRWLRDKIAALFDIEQPTAAQERLLAMADLRLTLLDLPAAAYRTHKAELFAMVQSQFGPPPSETK
jgi:hypothetical protein